MRDDSLGAEIKERRQWADRVAHLLYKLRWSQSRLATEMGVKKNTVGYWITASSTPTLDHQSALVALGA